MRVDATFMLMVEQGGRMEPDLDNLIKTTVDSLEGVLGVRTGTGPRVEADDVRVDRGDGVAPTMRQSWEVPNHRGAMGN